MSDKSEIKEDSPKGSLSDLQDHTLTDNTLEQSVIEKTKEETETENPNENKSQQETCAVETNNRQIDTAIPSTQSDEIMDQMKAPPQLSFEGNLKENWTRWSQLFTIYMEATGLNDKQDKRKVAVFLNMAGPEAVQKFSTFKFENEADKEKYSTVLKAFEDYCTPKKNEIVERHIFNSRTQKNGENFMSFYTDLIKLSASCEFAELKDSLIRDRIVSGISDNHLRGRLLREDNLDLTACVKMCKAAELSDLQLKTLNNEKNIDAINVDNKKKNNKKKKKEDGINGQRQAAGSQYGSPSPYNSTQSQQQRQQGERSMQQQQQPTTQRHTGSQQQRCGRCGRSHAPRNCPAYGKNCNVCGGMNHFSNVCKKRDNRVHAVEQDEPDFFIAHLRLEENENSRKNDYNVTKNDFLGNKFCSKDKVLKRESYVNEKMEIYDIESDNENKFEWFETIQVNKKCRLRVKLDTGAKCNVISKFDLNKINRDIALKPTSAKLCAYGGGRIEVLGTCDLLCKFFNREEAVVKFIVAKGSDLHFPTIIGLPTLLQFNLIKRVDLVKNVKEKDLIKNYEDVFTGHGVINKFEYEIKVNDDAKGKIVACRKVPVALLEPLKKELNKLLKLKLIEKVTEPTEWVNPIVITQKKDGSIRLCLDPTELNKHIKRHHHVIPSFDELCARMPNAKVFSTLDADRAFWQIKLSENSTKFVTFITPFGRFKFNVMPYGISSATEIFQFCFDEIFGGLEGVIILVDDILVWGVDEDEHDARLEKVLERARERNVKFNREKLQLKRKSVKYVGHIFSDEGIKVDDDKVKSIVGMKEPKNKDELATFLGMLAYVGRFIPDLSDRSASLRELIKRDTAWVWDSNSTQVFNELKQVLAKAPVLKYYDVNKPVVLSVDASQGGLGAVILQDNLPVAYASKALTDTEKAYAQIEKEALAIVFGCNRFHQFLFGKTVLVESDHKPLEVLWKKPINECPMRIQRMRLVTQKYDLEVRHKAGKELLLADALSRNYLQGDGKEVDCEIENFVHSIVSNLPITIDKKELFKRETEKDEELQMIKKYILKGWPLSKKQVPDNIKNYFIIADELSVVEDLVFKNNRLVVPRSLRNEMLNLIHYHHLGIEKCKNRAREILYWPFMNKEIENMISNCEICCMYKKTKVKEPLMPRELPSGPWQMIGLDLFDFKGVEHLLIVDYFSKYVEVFKLSSTNSSSIVEILKFVFSRLGVPITVCSDNGPQFDSHWFKDFAREWDFVHETSSPYWPRSNGMVERYVQTVKDIFEKIERDGRCPYLALLEYRNTPIDNDIKSPNELMFGTKVKGIIPVRNIINNKIDLKEIRNKLVSKQEHQKEYYDRKSHVSKQTVEVGERVFVRKEKDKPLMPGLIVRKCVRPRSYRIKMENGREIERNTAHIYPCKTEHNYNGSGRNSRDDLKSGCFDNNHNNVSVNKTSAVNQNVKCGDVAVRQNVLNECRQNVPDNNVNLNVSDNENVNQENAMRTRSGRIVKSPEYLKDYICDSVSYFKGKGMS